MLKDIQKLEQTAFTLFPRESSTSYKRAVCYLVLNELDKQDNPMSLSKLQQKISVRYAVAAEDVRAALSVLKCPAAFNAIRMWSHKQNQDVTLIRSVHTQELDGWLAYIGNDHPHIAALVH